MSWKDDAACRDVDTALFFKAHTTGPAATGHYDRARAICASCPVRIECLEYAMSTKQEAGIWGGLDEDERRRERARRRNATRKEYFIDYGIKTGRITGRKKTTRDRINRPLPATHQAHS